jgi:ribulose-phosphate 3-epimerase
MTVNPGFSGQAFIPEMLSKVKQISGLINQTGRPIRLEVDGGINAENILDLQSAGANTFVSASSIFNHADGISAGVTALKNAIV